VTRDPVGFLLLGGGSGSDFISMGLLVGQILYPAGLSLFLLNPYPVPMVPELKLNKQARSSSL
jgi:hypothetical protein